MGAVRYKVLSVDDDPGFQASLAAVLEDEYAVTTCSSGSRALELLQREPFDVLCSDFNMPGMDGVELISRASGMGNPMGLLLVTGSEQEATSRLKGMGELVLLMTKPFDPARLLRQVARLVGLVEIQRTLAPRPQAAAAVK
jgi:CheY-like chemotaxis protein